MKLSKHSMNQIAQEISSLINQHVNIMDEKGIIIASTDKRRIGTFHEGAKKVIDDQLEQLIIHSDNDYQGAKKGINLPVIVEEKIVCVIGMTGEYEKVNMYGKIVKKMTEILLRETLQKEEEALKEKAYITYLEEWLFRKDVVYSDYFIAKGKLLDIDITLERRVMVLGVLDYKNFEDSNQQEVAFNKIGKIIKRCIQQESRENLFFRWNGKFIIMVENCSEKHLDTLALAIQQKIKNEIQIEVAIGIDQKSKDYKEVHKAYNYAKKALVAASTWKAPTIQKYKDIHLELVATDLPLDVKKEFVDKVFCDASHEEIEEWIEIIMNLIVFNGAIRRVAEELYMHKNTLQYKLNKINQKTGYNPRCLKDSGVFQLAIIFYKELKERKIIEQKYNVL